jgi:polyphosphate kinase
MGDSKKAKKRGVESRKAEKLGGKEYEARLEKLHVELVELQQWVQAKGLKVCVIFEGRDGAARAGRSRRSPSA